MGMGLLTGNHRRLRILAPACLFALAFGIRALPWRSVLLGDRVLPFGSDAFYHLRRIAHSVLHFPDVLVFDPYINFPTGAKPIWAPAFDWTIALALRPFVAGDLEKIERLAIWVPPVLGAATVVSLYLLARRHFDLPTAVLAGAILSLLSAHFWYSQVGFVDHHAAVALVSTWVLAAGMNLLSHGHRESRAWRAGIGAGIAFGLSLLVWPGCVLHVSLVETALIAALLVRKSRAEAVALAFGATVANATALLMVLPLGLLSSWPQWGRFSPVVSTGFQPWLFGALTLWSAICAGAWSRSSLGARRRTRMASGWIAGGLVLTASAALLPGLADGLVEAWVWLGKADSFQGLVGESVPLFAERDSFTTRVATARLSYFVLGFPLSLAVAARMGRRQREPVAFALFLWWASCLFVVTMLQKRFINSFSVALALLMAWTVIWTWRSLPPRWGASRARRIAAAAALAGVVLALLLPVLPSYRTHVSNQIHWWKGGLTELTPLASRNLVRVQMAEWLRAHTPETSGWMGAGVPEYGVLAPWGLGHVIEHVARRPTVTNGFGDDIGEGNFLLARRYFLAAEIQACELLEAVKARYVVAQAAVSYLGETPDEASMLRALAHRDGAEVPPTGDGPRAAALARHRLVYESEGIRKRAPPSYKVYEFVPGARIVGAAPAGARVRLKLPLRTNRGRSLVYAASAVADSEGRYLLRVPYANVGGPPAVVVAADYALECGDEVLRVRVREADVRAGAEVRGPSLCGSSEPRAGSTVHGTAGAQPGLL
jgi:dolichyl-diphosphooligosaccharide--protein glycosyltransferase